MAVDVACARQQVSMREVARRHGLGRSSLWRHCFNGHIPAVIVDAAALEEVEVGHDLAARLGHVLDLLEREIGRVDGLLSMADDPEAVRVGQLGLARMSREFKAVAQVLGQVRGDLASPVVAVVDPRIVGVLMEALGPFPAARAAASVALLDVDAVEVAADA